VQATAVGVFDLGSASKGISEACTVERAKAASYAASGVFKGCPWPVRTPFISSWRATEDMPLVPSSADLPLLSVLDYGTMPASGHFAGVAVG
jgi:hypothetical protein